MSTHRADSSARDAVEEAAQWDIGDADDHEHLPTQDALGIRLRIVGDGTRAGTRVETLDGVPLQGVVRVDYSLEAALHVGHAVITVRRVAIDVEAPAMLTEQETGQ